jgi:cyclic pyranopterin phosphate synthase
MNLESRLIRSLRPWLRRHQNVKRIFRASEQRWARLRHDVAQIVPSVIRPRPRQITIAVTAACNLRCIGCRYGRDFMVGEQLDLATVRDALTDARRAGVATVRFYGGEPLLHPDLSRMVAHAAELGMDAYVTTNGTLLDRRIDELYAAGLRWLTIGFYGVGDRYDRYTQRPGHFERLRRGLSAVRERFGAAVQVQINYMLSRHSCSIDDVRAAIDFARAFDLHLHVDPISKAIPFFRDPTGVLDLTEEHRAQLEAVTAELLRYKAERPDRVPPSATFLRALPDLLLHDAAHAIPCDAYELIWVGADGSVQLCDTHFPLGSLREERLRDILFSPAHCRAAIDGFRLRCPACMCKIDSRMRRHTASIHRYGK